MSGAEDATAFKRLVQRLEGRELIDEKTGDFVAILQRQLSRDDATRGYLAQASTWASVTPVILPGYDAVGNRVTVQDGNMVATETPNALNQLKQVAGAVGVPAANCLTGACGALLRGLSC